MDELAKARRLLDDTTKLAQSNTSLVRVCQKLSRKIKADILFLEKSKSKVSQASSNIPYLSGVLTAVKESEDVQDVICDLRRYGIVVDVVCDGGKTWKKVIARNPQSLHLIWAGQGQYGTKDVVKKAEKYLNCGKLHSEFAPPSVICVFYNGVTHEMAEALVAKGISVEGERLDVSQEVKERLTAVFSDVSDTSEDEVDTSSEDEQDEKRPLDAPQSAMVHPEHHQNQNIVEKIQQMPAHGKVLLDITTMLAYVSDICNGGCDFEFAEPLLAKQAADERQRPALHTIKPSLLNRMLITNQSAIDDYWSIVNLMGGIQEKGRARELTDRLTIVPDLMSQRFCNLSVSGKIKRRSKLIFGTADMLRCEILTSNEGFVRAASAQDVHIVSAILHQPRALSEQKKMATFEKKNIVF